MIRKLVSKKMVSMMIIAVMVVSLSVTALAGSSNSIYSDEFASSQWKNAGFGTISKSLVGSTRLPQSAAIQWILFYDGYFGSVNQSNLTTAVDGYFGTNSDSAIRLFQAFENLSVDGIVGPNTWEKLSKYIARDNKQGAEISVAVCNRNGYIYSSFWGSWIFTHYNTGKWSVRYNPYTNIGGGYMN